MTTLYKLTTSCGKTRKSWNNEKQWGEGVKHRATGDKRKGLCSDAYIHAYEHPIIALIMNPVHANFHNPLLWEAQGRIIVRSDDGKVGCRSLTTIKRIEKPKIILSQLQCAFEYCGFRGILLDKTHAASIIYWGSDDGLDSAKLFSLILAGKWLEISRRRK